jgi:hypothetical protein
MANARRFLRDSLISSNSFFIIPRINFASMRMRRGSTGTRNRFPLATLPDIQLYSG